MLRRIDVSTIRKNPNAGRQVYLHAGQVTCRDTWDLGDRIETRIRALAEPSDQDVVVETAYRDGRPPKEPRLIRQSQEREVSRVHTMEPEPDYLFKFEKLEVRCVHCGKAFDYSEMESDAVEADEDGWPYTAEICPHCKAHEPLAVQVREETIEAALKRAGRKGD